MFQFTHIKGFALSASTKSKGKAFSVADIIGEVVRDPENSPHVENPKPPTFLHGDEETIRAILPTLETRVAAWNAEQKSQGGKALRKDTQVLFTQIASFKRDGTPEEYAEWKRLNMLHFRKQYGKDLVAVVEHTDEEHPHLHAYVVPSEGSPDVKRFHPGYVASKGVKDPKEQRRLYTKAMRDFQDSYYSEVGIHCGMTRLGPARRRLSRGEWKAEQASAKAIANALDHVKTEQAKLDAERIALAKRQDDLDAIVAAKAEALKKADAVALLKKNTPPLPEEPKMWEAWKMPEFIARMKKIISHQSMLVANLPRLKETVELIRTEAKKMKQERDDLVSRVQMLAEHSHAWTIVQQIAPDVAQEVLRRMSKAKTTKPAVLETGPTVSPAPGPSVANEIPSMT